MLSGLVQHLFITCVTRGKKSSNRELSKSFIQDQHFPSFVLAFPFSFLFLDAVPL